MSIFIKDMIKKEVRTLSIKPFSFEYVEAITGDDVIKGGGLYFLNKHIFTIAHCNNLWIDENSKPYQFKKDGDIWFLRKWAINFK